MPFLSSHRSLVTPFLGKRLGDAFPYVIQPLDIHIQLTRLSETMAEHRARSLSALLPTALATGYSEIFAHHCLAGRGPIESARPGCLREGRRRALRVKVLHRSACIKDG